MKHHLFRFFLLSLFLYFSARIIDYYCPPDLSRYQDLSPITVDQKGEIIHIGLSNDEKYRLPIATIPAHYRSMLIAYEDRRFQSHHGVDFLAIARAFAQNLKHQRIVSGASTLSMQTARLLEPRPRTLKNKCIEAFRAWQLERRYSKTKILTIYATLAPMGGNYEGIETAAYHYFDKSAIDLSPAETAWLIALPQSPQRLKNSQRAQAAVEKVLLTAYKQDALSKKDYTLALIDAISPRQYKFPALARHYRARFPNQRHTPLDKNLQQAFEQRLSQAVKQEAPQVSYAALLLDNQLGLPLAYIGNADYFSEKRQGAVDILTAVRSPGSTLKPFAYLAAFSRFHYRPDTLIDDSPIHENSWRPSNYDGQFLGRITLADALRLSRNIPAVRIIHLLDAGEFSAWLQRNHLTLHFPNHNAPTAALILGGVGIRAEELAQIYRQLAQCTFKKTTLATMRDCQQITRILQQVGDIHFGAEKWALKTGTSYGWRDLWLIGYSKKYTLLLWRGRADGGFAQEKSSADTLMPLYQDLIALLPEPPQQVKPLPVLSTRPLPAALRRTGTAPTFAIIRPVDGSRIEGLSNQSIVIETQNGTPPYQWFVNSHYLKTTVSPRLNFKSQSSGYYQLRALDGNGKIASITFTIKTNQAKTIPSVQLQQD